MKDKSHQLNQGSCLCGKVRFTVVQFLPVVGHCHCSMCQKFHGAAFSTYGEVKLEHLHWLSGEQCLAAFTADNGTVRKFCQNCGSSLLFESKYNRQNHTIEIALAAFDSLTPIEPNAHIYTESQVPWLTITDDLPKYRGYRK